MSASTHQSFFDSALVKKATTAAERRVLSKFGAYTRQRARSLLRYRMKPSLPGQPPSVHRSLGRAGKRSVSPLRELLYFAFERRNGKANVVIGPVPFMGPVGVVPPILEYGGRLPARKNLRRVLRRLGGSGEIRIGGPHTNTTKRNADGKYVTYASLQTAEQVTRANLLNEQLYGPLELPAAQVESRPFMRPAFTMEQSKLPALWSGAIK